MIQLSWTSVLSVIVSCGILQSPWPLKRPKSALVMYRVVIQLFVLPFLLGILGILHYPSHDSFSQGCLGLRVLVLCFQV